MTIRGLIFDLDGVIADTTALHRHAWSLLAAEHGLPFDETQADAMLGRSRTECLDILLAGRALCPLHRDDMLRRKQTHFLAVLEGSASDRILPGAREVLRDARALGLAVALASSSQNARPILASADLLDAFDVIADGHDPVPSKPAPDIFELAASRMSLPTSDTIVFEDSAAGIEGACAAGAGMVVAVSPALKAKAKYWVRDLAEINLVELLDEAGSQ